MSDELKVESIIRKETFFITYNGEKYVRVSEYCSKLGQTGYSWKTRSPWRNVSPDLSENLEELFIQKKRVFSKSI